MHITTADVWAALRAGLRDFARAPGTGVIIGGAYAAIGLVMLAAAYRNALVPLIMPMLGAFAFVGPFAAIAHYRLSRRLERGVVTPWWATPVLFTGPRSGAVFALGMILLALTFAWIGIAGLMTATMLPAMDEPAAVMNALVTTDAGHRLMLFGGLIGAAFAFPIFAVSVVAFPMLVDRDVDLVRAALTSCSAVAQNPVPMALWAVVVGVGLILAALPLMLGFVVVTPVLGHATWHLYRRVILA